MYRKIDGRGSGKAADLIRGSEETHIPILCATRVDWHKIIEMAEVLGREIPLPIVFNEDHCGVSDVLVDDLEKITKLILSSRGYDLVGYNISIN